MDNRFWQVLFLLLGWIIGLFTKPLSEMIERVFRGPKLQLEFDGANQDFRIRTPIIWEIPGSNDRETLHAIFVRVRVNNCRGWRMWTIRSAKDCKGYLVKIERRNLESGKFESVGYCDSLPLKWSYLDDVHANSGITIPEQIAHYLNVVATFSNRPDFVPEVVMTPLRYERLFDPGICMSQGNENDYAIRLTIQVCAEEARVEEIAIVLEWKGAWDNFCAYGVENAKANVTPGRLAATLSAMGVPDYINARIIRLGTTLTSPAFRTALTDNSRRGGRG
jgi:hypothetical protein